ncbi:MAG: hypothetical protein R3F33_10310 [Planctomycetota bacterium]
MNRFFLAPLALALVPSACQSTQGGGAPKTHVPEPPIPGLVNVDHLILPQETHFAHLWQVTRGGENAEAYWSFDGKALSMQSTVPGASCDRIFHTSADGLVPVSNGKGVTTCAYYMPDGKHVLFASTQSAHEECPPKADQSRGYVWALYPEYDIFVRNIETGEEHLLIGGPGYDAEATVAPTGDKLVFTSLRSGDVELWTANLDGTNLHQVTDKVGYDGGAFFSPDGQWLVFRSTEFGTEDRERRIADYQSLLAQDLVRPSRMELMLVKADGSERRQLTQLGGANFAPSFFPGGKRIIFATNHHDSNKPAMNFDMFAVDIDGGNLERISWFNGEDGKQFDGFPLFSPDGRFLAFSSNRGDGPPRETNVFIAEWK